MTLVRQSLIASPILPVVDVTLPSNTQAQLDAATATWLDGSVKIYKDHNGQLNPDGSLNLTQVRTGTLDFPQAAMGIKRRGHSSLSFPKANYSLELRTSPGGNGLNQSVLGMPAESDWVLYGCWNDRTCLRAATAYWLAASFMDWAPRFQFAELFVNGDYRGLYMVIEKIKIDDNRVAMDKANAANLTGGYIIKREGSDLVPPAAWESTSSAPPGNPLRWTASSPDPLDPAMLNFISNHMNTFEAMFRDGTYRTTADYRSLIDMQSFTSFVIMQEVSNNVDGYWKSMHMVKKSAAQGGKLFMGPVWDFDGAFQNFADNEAAVRGCQVEYSRWQFGSTYLVIQGLMREPGFRRELRRRWTGLRTNNFISGPLITGQIDTWYNKIKEARARDNVKWPTINGSIAPWQPCYQKATLAEEVAALKDFITKRIAWLDRKMPALSFSDDATTDLFFVDSADNSGHVATSDGTKFGAAGTGQWFPANSYGTPFNNSYYTGDFNGDGLTDLAAFEPSDGSMHVNLANGNNGFFGAGSARWIQGVSDSAPAKIFIGDYNGDGRSDVGIRHPFSDAVFKVALSTGASFSTSTVWSIHNYGGRGLWSGDITGDGLADLLVVSNNNAVRVGVSTGTAIGEALVWTAAGQFGDWNNSYFPGDFDGDGKTDIGTWEPDNSSFLVRLSTGTTFGASNAWVPSGWLGNGSTHKFLAPGDYDGDGRDDLGILATDFQFHVATSTGSGFFGPRTGQWTTATTFRGSSPKAGAFAIPPGAGIIVNP